MNTKTKNPKMRNGRSTDSKRSAHAKRRTRSIKEQRAIKYMQVSDRKA